MMNLMTLRVLLVFLQNKYKIKAYIDSRDPSMPKVTSAETATRIKDRISRCDEFILLQLMEPLIQNVVTGNLVLAMQKNIISILLCFQ